MSVVRAGGILVYATNFNCPIGCYRLSYHQAVSALQTEVLASTETDLVPKESDVVFSRASGQVSSVKAAVDGNRLRKDGTVFESLEALRSWTTPQQLPTLQDGAVDGSSQQDPGTASSGAKEASPSPPAKRGLSACAASDSEPEADTKGGLRGKRQPQAETNRGRCGPKKQPRKLAATKLSPFLVKVQSSEDAELDDTSATAKSSSRAARVVAKEKKQDADEEQKAAKRRPQVPSARGKAMTKEKLQDSVNYLCREAEDLVKDKDLSETTTKLTTLKSLSGRITKLKKQLGRAKGSNLVEEKECCQIEALEKAEEKCEARRVVVSMMVKKKTTMDPKMARAALLAAERLNVAVPADTLAKVYDDHCKFALNSLLATWRNKESWTTTIPAMTHVLLRTEGKEDDGTGTLLADLKLDEETTLEYQESARMASWLHGCMHCTARWHAAAVISESYWSSLFPFAQPCLFDMCCLVAGWLACLYLGILYILEERAVSMVLLNIFNLKDDKTEQRPTPKDLFQALVLHLKEHMTDADKNSVCVAINHFFCLLTPSASSLTDTQNAVQAINTGGGAIFRACRLSKIGATLLREAAKMCFANENKALLVDQSERLAATLTGLEGFPLREKVKEWESCLELASQVRGAPSADATLACTKFDNQLCLAVDSSLQELKSSSLAILAFLPQTFPRSSPDLRTTETALRRLQRSDVSGMIPAALIIVDHS